jgi:3-dehydroquinate synthase
MQLDKKVAHGRLRFVLPTQMGHVELVGDVPEADVLAVLRGGA